MTHSGLLYTIIRQTDRARQRQGQMGTEGWRDMDRNRHKMTDDKMERWMTRHRLMTMHRQTDR